MANAFTLFGELKADTQSFKNSLRDADASLVATERAISTTEGKARSLGVTTAASARQFDRFNDTLSQARERLAATAAAFERGEASQAQMRAALLAVERTTAGVSSRLADAAARAEDFSSRTSAAAEKAAARFAQSQERMRIAAEEAASGAALSWDKFSDRLSAAGGRMQSVGAGLTVALTAPLVLAGKELLTAGTSYETALNIFEVTTRATAEQMQKAKKVAQDLGADLTLPATSAKDAALAMVELGKAGLTATQSMDAAKGVLQLAAAAQIGEAQAAEIAANALNAFGLSANESTRIADLLAAAANASSAEITDVAQAMAQASATFSAAHVPIETLTTAIAEMANAGIKGSDAGTSLKTFLQRLTPTTKDAIAAMDELGLRTYDSAGKMKPFATIIGDFEAALSKLTDKDKAEKLNAIFGSDAIRAAQVLFKNGAAGMATMQAAVTQLGSAASLANAKTQGLGGAWSGLLSQIETIGIKIYDVVAEPLTKVVRIASDLAGKVGEAFTNSPAAVQALSIALTVAAAAAGPLLVILGSLVAAGGAVAAGVTSIAAAVGLVGGLAPALAIVAGALTGIVVFIGQIGAAVALMQQAWVTNFGGLRDYTLQAWEGIKAATNAALSTIYDYVVYFGEEAVSWFRDNWPLIRQTVQSVSDRIKTTIQAFLDTVSKLWQAHGTEITAVARSVWELLTAIASAAMTMLSGAIKVGMNLINGNWAAAWESFLQIIRASWAASTNFIVTAFSTFIPTALSWANRLTVALASAVAKGLAQIVVLIADFPMMIIKLIPQMVSAGWSLGEAIMEGVQKGLREAMNPTASLSGTAALDSPTVEGVLADLLKAVGIGTGPSGGLGGAFQAAGSSLKDLIPAPPGMPSLAGGPSPPALAATPAIAAATTAGQTLAGADTILNAISRELASFRQDFNGKSSAGTTERTDIVVRNEAGDAAKVVKRPSQRDVRNLYDRDDLFGQEGGMSDMWDSYQR
jgi:TP901 family phage tail tape measure protein